MSDRDRSLPHGKEISWTVFGDHGDPDEVAKQRRALIKSEVWKTSFPEVSTAQNLHSLSKAPRDGPVLDGYLDSLGTPSLEAWLCPLPPWSPHIIPIRAP